MASNLVRRMDIVRRSSGNMKMDGWEHALSIDPGSKDAAQTGIMKILCILSSSSTELGQRLYKIIILTRGKRGFVRSCEY